MRNFEFIHIINYIIEKEIHIFVHENNYKIINHTDAAQFLVFCNMTLLFPDVYGLQDWNIKDYEPGKELRLNVSEYKIDDKNPLFYQDMQKEFKWKESEMNYRYLSTEVIGGFTGVMLGLFAQGDDGYADFDWFEYITE